jgi:hypothetical protein
MLAAERGLPNVLDVFGSAYLFGTWVKKEIYEMDMSAHEFRNNPNHAEGKGRVNQDGNSRKKKGNASGEVENVGPVLRKRARIGSFNWAEFSESERVRFVASKYWPTTMSPTSVTASSSASTSKVDASSTSSDDVLVDGSSVAMSDGDETRKDENKGDEPVGNNVELSRVPPKDPLDWTAPIVTLPDSAQPFLKK